jgi:hypothetical protein
MKDNLTAMASALDCIYNLLEGQNRLTAQAEREGLAHAERCEVARDSIDEREA